MNQAINASQTVICHSINIFGLIPISFAPSRQESVQVSSTIPYSMYVYAERVSAWDEREEAGSRRGFISVVIHSAASKTMILVGQSSFMKSLLWLLLGCSLVPRWERSETNMDIGNNSWRDDGGREKRSEERCKDWRIVTGPVDEAEQLMNHKSYACVMQDIFLLSLPQPWDSCSRIERDTWYATRVIAKIWKYACLFNEGIIIQYGVYTTRQIKESKCK